ncbi:hypothetical protein C2869_18440 [Saccharobesus litoralis]|uniref:Surface lipoprotein assembly modifier C-terminal domain-containing protein n=1 Tax=Saccharobesus litoralis TaxID=2172099 RepID=A0A2S0VVY8_9ALTE|nr:surface lipoprotein assembly modifier [Saccharobesus litoralis]AWB68270.1 hypothetical protein C2869_18440 [Saccharobesus litoralis]
MCRTYSKLAAISFTLFFSTISQANEVKFNVSVNAGLLNDSRLTIAELDQVSNQADVALSSGVKAGMNWQPNADWNVKLSYGLDQKNYQDFDEYDLFTQQLNMGVERKFSGFNLGVNYLNVSADLDGQDFLALNQVSVYWSNLINNRYFFRVATDITDKEFALFSGRNADNLNINGQAFVFFDNAERFVMLGVGQEWEDSQNALYQYEQQHIQANFSQKWQWFGANQVQLKLQAKQRDYDQFTIQESGLREDTLYSVGVNWQHDFNPEWSIKTDISYKDNQSNFTVADYDETLTSVMLHYSYR